MAEACCPASCGELLQGWISGSEKLISCPIDWFSTVEVCDGTPEHYERPRMRQMVKAVLHHYDLPKALSQTLRIRFDSTIPVAKGLASSTADIAATAIATANHLKKKLSEVELAQLCIAIEPTDSTIFTDLTLFDHNQGKIEQSYCWAPNIDILILESPIQLNTADYHHIDRRQKLLDSSPALANAWLQFQQSVITKNHHELGKAATISAQASQHILPKPAFGYLFNLIDKYSLFGLNVAHSGTIVGLMMDRHQHDIEKITNDVVHSQINHYYPRHHLVKMTNGGVR
jgi:L-threonine kinase